jgi:hypothetical protein
LLLYLEEVVSGSRTGKFRPGRVGRFDQQSDRRYDKAMDTTPDNHVVPPAAPTDALPGTSAKVDAMRARFERREALFHPLDAGWEAADDALAKALAGSVAPARGRYGAGPVVGGAGYGSAESRPPRRGPGSRRGAYKK